MPDPHPIRFDGEVWTDAGERLGEARFWAVRADADEGPPWRGWLRLDDLRRTDLPAGRYRLRATAGWEAAFETGGGRPSRVFETDLLAITGLEPPPWADADEPHVVPPAAKPYVDLWSEAPGRSAHTPRRALELDPLDDEPSPLGENPDTPVLRVNRF